MGVLGVANNSHISGVLVLRGQDHKAVVEVAPDWESYEYKKLDIYGDEEDKKFFEAALAWDLSVDGKAWADGKNVRTPFLTVVSFLTGFSNPVQVNGERSMIVPVLPWGTAFSTMASYDFGYRNHTCP